MNANALMDDTAGAVDSPGMTASPIPRSMGVALLCVIILGVGLRFAGLGVKPLWEDEAWTFHTATAPQGVLAVSGLDPHPLSFYMLYSALPNWIFQSDAAFRLPAAVFSSLALLLFAGLMRVAALDHRLSLVSVAFFALLPINIRYAFEARAYALAECLAIAVLYAYLVTLRGTSVKRLAELAVAVALSCHIDGFGLAAPFAVFLHAIIRAKTDPRIRRVLIAVLIGGLAAAPYYYFRLGYFSAHPGVHAIGESGSLANGFFSRVVELSPLGIGFDQVSGAHRWVIYVAAAACLAIMLKAARTPPEWWGNGARSLFAIFAIVTPVIYAAMSLTLHANLIHKKYLLVTVAALTPLFAAGLIHLTRRARGVAPLCLTIVSLAVSIHLLIAPGGRADWRSLYEQLKSDLQPGDVFLQERQENYPEYAFGPLRAYAWRDGAVFSNGHLVEYAAPSERRDAAASPTIAADWTSNSDRLALLEKLKRLGTGRRIWALSTDWMAEGRTLDLSSLGRRGAGVSSRGVRATLWILDGRL